MEKMANKIVDESYVRVMTVKDVAQYLKISEAKVYYMANKSQLPAFRIGRSWRFQKDLIDSWIKRSSNLMVVGEAWSAGKRFTYKYNGIMRLL